MAKKIPGFLSDKLNKRLESGLFRSIVPRNDSLADFSSNDYLGIARNTELATQTVSYWQEHGGRLGSGGSRLVSGTSGFHESLENQLAVFFKAESALLFNSGYDANASLPSVIAGRHDLILYDEYIHASIREGIKLADARAYSFRHNDPESLATLLKRHDARQIYVFAESLYSMHGDIAPLETFTGLCEEHDALLIVDEAHSTGIYGQYGEGLCCALGLEDKIFARVHTFGKAVGAFGACIAGSRELTALLINFARPFIYTTALPDLYCIFLSKALTFLADDHRARACLFDNIRLFRSLLSEKDLRENMEGSPIQSIFIGDNERVKAMEANLRRGGMSVKGILSPTVPTGSECLRVNLHCFNTQEEIIKLSNLLNV